jgi:hypothetical protein
VAPDFTKTAEQIERSIAADIEEAQRKLLQSQSHIDSKSRVVWGAIVVLAVFLGQVGLQWLLEPSSRAIKEAQTTRANESFGQKEKLLASSYLRRIDEQITTISRIKTRVAPAMQIERPLGVASESVRDLRILLGIEEVQPSLAGSSDDKASEANAASKK